jgi:hypothetical protein
MCIYYRIYFVVLVGCALECSVYAMRSRGYIGIVLLFNTYTLFYIWAPFGMPGAGGWAREKPFPIVNGFSEL